MRTSYGEIEEEALAYGIVGTGATEPSPADPALRARLLRSARAGAPENGRYGIFADRLARLFSVPIERVQKLLRKIEDPSVFAPFMVPGIAMLPLRPGPDLEPAIAAIGILMPGTTFPHHDHVGDEVTFVLDGGFRDMGGREIWRGDELYKPAGSDHEFLVIGDRPCVAAVLARGGVAFR
jgi:hypothetical protein